MNNNVNVSESPSMFCEGGLNYKVLSFDARTVEVAKNPNASGNITIPSQVTYNGITYAVVGIGDNAFDRNKKITSISLPNTIKYVGYCAFQTLSISMTLPSSLEKVAGSAFTYNTFADLNLPSGLKEIGGSAFGYTTVQSGRAIIPASVVSIDGNGFYGSSIREISVSDNNPSYKSISGVLFSKDAKKLITYPHAKADAIYAIPTGVTTIGKESFENNRNLTHLVIPATVNKLEDCALWSCPGMRRLEVKNSIPPVVGAKSLNGVKSDCVIVVPKGCAVRYKAAAYWKGLASCIVEEGSSQPVGGNSPAQPSSFAYNGLNYKVLSFDARTVEVAKNPNASGAITIPSQVTYNGIAYAVVGIGDNAFDRNKNIKQVSLPSTIKYVGYCAFQALRISMTLPSSLEKVARSAFTYNTFADLNLPSGLKEIGGSAFGYTTVQSGRAIIPASVVSIDGNGFYGSSIREISVSADNPSYKSISGVLFSKDAKKLITYPHAKADAIYAIPTGVTTIGKESFENNRNLTHLVIPATVNKLEDCALWSCPGMRRLEVKNSIPPVVGAKSLNGVKSDCVIIVPKGSARSYKTSEGWKQFNIVEI